MLRDPNIFYQKFSTVRSSRIQKLPPLREGKRNSTLRSHSTSQDLSTVRADAGRHIECHHRVITAIDTVDQLCVHACDGPGQTDTKQGVHQYSIFREIKIPAIFSAIIFKYLFLQRALRGKRRFFSRKINICRHPIQKQQPGDRKAVPSIVSTAAQNQNFALCSIPGLYLLRCRQGSSLHQYHGWKLHLQDCETVTILHFFSC